MKTYIAEFTERSGNQISIEYFKAKNLKEAKFYAQLHKNHHISERCSTSVRVAKSN